MNRVRHSEYTIVGLAEGGKAMGLCGTMLLGTLLLTHLPHNHCSLDTEHTGKGKCRKYLLWTAMGILTKKGWISVKLLTGFWVGRILQADVTVECESSQHPAPRCSLVRKHARPQAACNRWWASDSKTRWDRKAKQSRHAGSSPLQQSPQDLNSERERSLGKMS